MIWRGVPTAWPRGPRSHPEEAQIVTFEGKRAQGREAREPAGGRPGGGGRAGFLLDPANPFYIKPNPKTSL